MSRRGRERAPADDVLLQVLDGLVETEGIVKAADRLGVTHRTAPGCHESRRVSRRMRGLSGKYLREQTVQSELFKEQAEQAAATGPEEPESSEPGAWGGGPSTRA